MSEPAFQVGDPVWVCYDGNPTTEGVIKRSEFASGEWWFDVEVDGFIFDEKVTHVFIPTHRLVSRQPEEA